jgi:hypothetical protein
MPRVARVVLALVVGMAALAGALAFKWSAKSTAQDSAAPPASQSASKPVTQPASQSVVTPAQQSVAPPGGHPTTQPLVRPTLAEPLDLVPAESLLCWYGRPFPDTMPISEKTSEIGGALVRILGDKLDAQTKIWARALEMFGLAIRQRHLMVLIDTQAKQTDSVSAGPRVDRLRFAAIVEVGAQAEAFKRIIQSAVNEQTDSEKATLARKQASGLKFQELRDQRLPTWCVFAWGEIGPYFVLTIGEDVWPMVAAVAAGEAPSLSQADWLRNARGKRGHDALIEIIVAAKGFRERLDPVVEGRATDFFRAWQCENLEWAHWALGFEGPAMYCMAHFVEGGQVRERLYADPSIRDARLLATIPETARYAIYRVSPSEVIPNFICGLLSTQGKELNQKADEMWAQLQKDGGFDAQRDILSHLGEYIVMHNDPPHPLHIPLAMTTLTEIKDDPKRVRETVDAMCQAWQVAAAAHVEKTGIPLWSTLEKDGSGIWYVQLPFAVAGPAWTVTDRFIITSWSPMALRSYLEKVGDRVGTLPK